VSFRETNSGSARQEIQIILCDHKVYYCVHKSPPVVPILNKINSCHIPTPCVFLTRFKIVHPTIPFQDGLPMYAHFPCISCVLHALSMRFLYFIALVTFGSLQITLISVKLYFKFSAVSMRNTSRYLSDFTEFVNQGYGGELSRGWTPWEWLNDIGSISHVSFSTERNGALSACVLCSCNTLFLAHQRHNKHSFTCSFTVQISCIFYISHLFQ
jgi:hypothetical protein